MARDVHEGPAGAGEVEHRGHDVFVSYSRADREIVVALTGKLSAAGKKAWVDLEDIPPSAEWMSEIRAAIGSSDGYVVVISPDLARSTVCEEELRNATEAGKRIVPVMIRTTDPSTVPDSLSRLNWIDASDGDLDAACAVIVDTLDTDLGYVKAHTRLLVRAAEWRDGSEDHSILLRGRELAEAERLIDDVAREPPPTQLQTRFVLASRRSSGRRQRAGVAVALVVALIAGSLGVFAWTQRSSAIENERLAVRRAAVSRSRELAAAATGELDVDPELSLLLAREALSSAETPEAVGVLRKALSGSSVRATLSGHDGPIASVAYDADGTHALTASYDGTARVWDLSAPDSPIVLAGHDDLVETASFNAEASRVVTASFDGTARVWDAGTGRQIAVLRGHVGAVRDASFNAAGTTIVTGGDDGTVRIWDAETGELQGTLRGHGRPVYDVSFSPDGRSILSASDDGTARSWDTQSGRTLHVLRGHEDGLHTASFAPDGSRIVTASQDGTAKVWDTDTGRLVSDLTGSRGPVVSASFSPDGRRIVTVSEDSDARIWNATSGDLVAILRGHSDQLNAASFSPDGRYVVTASVDGTARVFDATSGSQLAVLRGHDGSVLAATFSPDGSRVLTGGVDGTARVWEPISGEVVYQGDDVSNVFTDASGTDISISTWGGLVHVDDALTGKPVRSVRFPVSITGASFNGDGTMMSAAGVDGVTRIVDARSGETLTKLRGPKPVWTGADFWGRSDQLLTWGDDGTARLWDPRSGDELQVFDHGAKDGRIVYEAHLSRDGRRVFTTGQIDGKVEMWDASSGDRLWAEEGLLTGGGIGAGFSPDGSMVGIVASTTTIHDGDTGALISTLDDPGQIMGIVFSPDGRVVVTRANDGAARTWDPKTGELLTVMLGHGGAVNGAFFSEDGRWIATTADDGLTRVWDSATGGLVSTYPGAGGPGIFAQFAADDRVVVAASSDGVRIDRCDACGTLAELVELSDFRITRSLTEAERAEFLGNSNGTDTGILPPRRAGLVGADGEPVPDAVLAPGRYTTVGFEPSVSFAVGDGWQATTYLDRTNEGEATLSQVVQLQRLDSPANGLVIVDLGHGRAIDGRKDWDERGNVSPFPADLGRWLAGHPNLRSRTIEPTEIDGVQGETVETVVTSVPEGNPWPVCGGCVTLFAFTLENETGPLTTNDLINALGPGEVDRWIVLETETGTLLINYFSASRKDLRAFEPVVDDVLASMQIGG